MQSILTYTTHRTDMRFGGVVANSRLSEFSFVFLVMTKYVPLMKARRAKVRFLSCFSLQVLVIKPGQSRLDTLNIPRPVKSVLKGSLQEFI